MEVKETSLRTKDQFSILEDTEYYKYIFKKTEKMSCAVFYILRSDPTNRQTDSVVNDLETAAQDLLDASLESLRSTSSTIEKKAMNVRYMLMRFESKLRVAHAARHLSVDLLEVFLHEIDSVQRSLKKYTEPSARNPLEVAEIQYENARGKRTMRARIETAIQKDDMGTEQVIVGRRERVLSVLKDKGEATIKDIVGVVTDCSEKTIQRELTSLIKDNVILREGERRWSKYRLL
ncbi:MAG: hypothetical protein K9M10_00210 [Candidatus Pacebacteria bacterium]|nr:hypothetical protein [Candidatus Paceibacterota bacterium]MCF7856889.1 hypothetical protein [Candidatus Paceibacterota bacterium]